MFPECSHFRRVSDNYPECQCLSGGAPGFMGLLCCHYCADWTVDMWDAVGAAQQAAVKRKSRKRVRKSASSVCAPVRPNVECKGDKQTRDQSPAHSHTYDWSGWDPSEDRARVELRSPSPSHWGRPPMDKAWVECCFPSPPSVHLSGLTMRLPVPGP